MRDKTLREDAILKGIANESVEIDENLIKLDSFKKQMQFTVTRRFSLYNEAF